ncbi:MAG: hypothetical protein RQ936_03980 [Gammaproteobacteria bacterium]|nr:hypothetical protein [Gammaproteobacteria bacterium]
MEGISDIKIIGIDERRPPKILKEPYINLFFKLTHKAPKDWCEAFNLLIAKRKYPVKINPTMGLFVETWVRVPAEINASLDDIKKVITTCTDEYIARVEAEALAISNANADSKNAASVAQVELNKVIEALDFSD